MLPEETTQLESDGCPFAVRVSDQSPYGYKMCTRHYLNGGSCFLHFPLVFSNAHRVLSPCDTRLRLLYLLIKMARIDILYL